MSANSPQLSRRETIRLSINSSGALLLAITLPACSEDTRKSQEPPPNSTDRNFNFSAWLQLTPDNTIIVTLDYMELGQGTISAYASICANELGLEPSAIKVQLPSINTNASRPKQYRVKETGGSATIRSTWQQLSAACAILKRHIKHCASLQLKVPSNNITLKGLQIYNHATKEALPWSHFISIAALTPIKESDNTPLTAADSPRTLNSQNDHLQFTKDVISGKARYGIDSALQGDAFVLVEHGPYTKSTHKLMSFNKAKTIPGVIDIIDFEWGVAVVAHSIYTAQKALKELEIEWRPLTPQVAELSNTTIADELEPQNTDQKTTFINQGTATTSHTSEPATLNVKFPYIAHAPMETLSCRVNFDGTKCELTVGTHSIAVAQKLAAKILGIPLTKIVIESSFIGGSFGRRLTNDFLIEALLIAKRYKKPFVLFWQRSDEFRREHYRPCMSVTLSCEDQEAKALDLKVSLKGPGNVGYKLPKEILEGTAWVKHALKDTIKSIKPNKGPSHAAGGLYGLPYTTNSLQCNYTPWESPVDIGYWRSVGRSHNIVALECFIDQLAYNTHTPPLSYRLRRVSDPRMKAVITRLQNLITVEDRAGFAIHQGYDSYIAIAIAANNKGLPIKVTAVVDCGKIAHLPGAKKQIEGGIIMGISTALYEKAAIKNGKFLNINFDNYQLLRINEAPQIEIEFIPSKKQPGGLGELSTAPAAAATANAYLINKNFSTLNFPLV